MQTLNYNCHYPSWVSNKDSIVYYFFGYYSKLSILYYLLNEGSTFFRSVWVFPFLAEWLAQGFGLSCIHIVSLIQLHLIIILS